MPADPQPIHSTATLSPCGQYRYRLTRTWDAHRPPACWIMLNPSTADAREDDPTIRRCIAFARRWNCGGIIVVNLFALRSTDPRRLRSHPSPISEPADPDRNDRELLAAATGPVAHVCAAWGCHGRIARRGESVLQMLKHNAVNVCCLGRTKHLHPRHPLYAPADTMLAAV